MLRRNRKRNIAPMLLLVLLSVSAASTFVGYYLKGMCGGTPSLLFFFAPVFFSGFIGGFWAGAAATLLSCTVAVYFFMAPKFEFAATVPDEGIRLALFFVLSLIVSFLFEHMHANEFEIAQQKKDLEKKSAELERTNARLDHANAELHRFSAAAAHDLQEPLRSISTCLTLIERELGPSLPSGAAEHFVFVKNAVKRAGALICDLLSYSKASNEPIELTVIDCAKEAAQVLADLSALIVETQARISVDELPTLETSACLLREVLQNLISNAIKYRGERSPTIEISAKKRDAEWVFSICDTGIGIAPEMRERIFEGFRRLHGREIPGTGLGLKTCHVILVRLGGKIWVDSQPGKGSTFYFSLPA